MLGGNLATTILLCTVACAVSVQNWTIPEVVKPREDILSFPNIADRVSEISGPIFIHIPKGFYPDHFFLFVHIAKTGGSTVNKMLCPLKLSECGETCGCGNCGLPSYGKNPYPKFRDYVNSDCQLVSYEVPYTHFLDLYSNPISSNGRKIKMFTFLRNPYSYVKSQIGHYLNYYLGRNESGDRSAMVQRCINAEAHFDPESRCNDYDLQDGQTEWLGGGDIDVAISVVQNMFAVGITEYHEESMCLIQYQLGQLNHKKCNWKYIHHLKTGMTSTVWKTPLKNMDFDQDPVIRNLIVHHSQKDVILWRAGLKVFASRLKHFENESGIRILNPDDIFLYKYFLD